MGTPAKGSPALGEDTTIRTSVSGAMKALAAVVVVTATVLGTWWDLRGTIKDTSREVQEVQRATEKTQQEVREIRAECEQIKPKVEVLWNSHYGQQRGSTSNTIIP